MALLVFQNQQIFKSLCYSLIFFFSIQCSAQSSNGFVKGKVIDGSTQSTLNGVEVIKEGTSIKSATLVDGTYLLKLKKGSNNIIYKIHGFQTKVISNVNIQPGQITYLDILLLPIAQKLTAATKKIASIDSVKSQDSIVRTTFIKESHLSIYNQVSNSNSQFDFIPEANIGAGIDRNGVQILKRLNGVIVQDFPATPNMQSLNIFGLGDRYNQVLFNGTVLNSMEPLSKSYPLDMLPVQAYESVSVQKIANGSIPADFAGGTVAIKTKDFPDNNYFYLQAGGGFSDATKGKDFFSDKRNKWEALSFPGSIRELPHEFPTSKSANSFNTKNPQEQVYLSRQLKNNLAPVNYGGSKLNEQFLLGFGKIIQLKGGKKIGIIGLLNQSKTELIDESTVQIAPDVAANPFPFTDISKELIPAQATDINYRYVSQLGGSLNASLVYRQNKISLRNFFGSQFSNIYTQRTQVYKPDEDTLAHDGINYLTTQRKFLLTQLSGEHGFGINGRFKLNWQAAYNYSNQENPDERNFLLNHDPAYRDRYEIARPNAAPFIPVSNTPSSLDPNLTNSGRLWRNQTDNNFEGFVNILAPFNLFNQAQVISGGIDIQSKNRVFRSDLLPTKGTGNYSLDSLLAPERYYPGGLTVTNYFSTVVGSYSNVQPYNRGNYSASANFGSSYIRLQNQFSKLLSVDLSVRVESATQLVSNAEYIYVAGYRNPGFNAVDKNTFVNKIDILPSVLVKYQLVNKVQVHAAYTKTLNRPALQELTSYRYYDPIAFMVKIGNPILKTTSITNYDAGFNWVPNAGSSVSISGFYKQIDQPIEYILSAYTSSSMMMKPHNTAPATIRGIELAFRLKLNKISNASWLSNFSVFGNGTWLKSKVKAGPVRTLLSPIPEHTLSGSPDYAVNTGIIIQQPRFPEITILYNRTADYIAVLGSGKLYAHADGNTIAAIPDYRVKGKQQLDIQVGQKIFRSKMQITVGVTNLLDNPYIVYQDLNGNKKFDAPLILQTINNHGGYYLNGTDNTVTSIKSQRTYYLTLAYLFK